MGWVVEAWISYHNCSKSAEIVVFCWLLNHVHFLLSNHPVASHICHLVALVLGSGMGLGAMPSNARGAAMELASFYYCPLLCSSNWKLSYIWVVSLNQKLVDVHFNVPEDVLNTVGMVSTIFQMQMFRIWIISTFWNLTQIESVWQRRQDHDPRRKNQITECQGSHLTLCQIFIVDHSAYKIPIEHKASIVQFLAELSACI